VPVSAASWSLPRRIDTGDLPRRLEWGAPMTASHAGQATAAATATPKMKAAVTIRQRGAIRRSTRTTGSASLILAPMLLGRRVRSRSSRESRVHGGARRSRSRRRSRSDPWLRLRGRGELRGSSSERGCQSGVKVLRPLTRLKLLKPLEVAADRFVAARKARLQRRPRLFESDRAGGGEKPHGKLSANPCGRRSR
jgi:hypothetical protein